MSTINLQGDDARKKMTQLINDIDFCMLLTNLSTAPIHSIPMSTKKVDNDGAIYFLSDGLSDHNDHIKSNDTVQLIYQDAGDMEFLSLYGTAQILTDQVLIEELYSVTDDNWFNGKDDPSITVLKVIPTAAHYWNPKSNKMVSALKIGYTAITGDKTDIGNHGDLDLD